jgi:tetratricopeptide (TPR) repeat protein
MVKRQPADASPIPNFILKDDLNDTTNSIVMATQVFITTSTDLAVPTPMPSEQSFKRIKPFRRRKNYIWHQFQHGLTLLEQANVPSAFEDLQRGCAMAEGYLFRPTRQVLMSLLIVMGNRRWSRHQKAWMSVVRFMASMSSKMLGARHPLACIMNNMRSWEMMRVVAQPAMRVILDAYSRRLGPGHPEVLLLKQGLSVELMRDGDFDASEALILEACETSSATYGHASLARRNCLRRLGNLYVEQQRWDDAESVFENIIALDSEANRYHGPTDETSVFTCQNLSLLNCRRGDLARSGYWAQQELDLALKIYGSQDEYYADCLNRQKARLNGESCDRWFSWLEVS